MSRLLHFVARMACALLLVSSLPVSGAPVNLALGKPTTQSSVYQGNPLYTGSHGVDGGKSDSSMFHTNDDAMPWWEVDLGRVFAIDNVTLYNRVGCCAERIAGLQVWISADGVNYDLVHQHDSYVFRNRRAELGGLEARFVRVLLPRREYFHLQEVEVYQWGTWQPPSSRASVLRRTRVAALGGPATVTAEGGIGNWKSAGTGDCPGKDVSGSSGPNPVAAMCTAQFAGFTAVCWSGNCTYKNLPTAQCTGGASPGRMYTCSPGAGSGVPGPGTAGPPAVSTPPPAPTPPPASPPPPAPTPPSGPPPAPAPPVSSLGNWKSAGTGDCPGKDVSGSSGPNPVAAMCTAQFAGFTAVCWSGNCTYKNLPTAQCTGGASPGRMYTCAAAASASSVRYRVENFVFGAPDAHQNPRNYHDFLVDFAACTVRELNAEDLQGQEQYRVLVCRDRSRLTFTTSTPGKAPVEYDWVFGDGGRTISGAYRQGATFGPSVGTVR